MSFYSLTMIAFVAIEFGLYEAILEKLESYREENPDWALKFTDFIKYYLIDEDIVPI